MKDPYAEIEYQCASMIDYLTALCREEDMASLCDLHEQILKAVNAQMELRYQKLEQKPADHIRADAVCVQIRDQEQNRLYHRLLPLDFEENNNGIQLKGEDLYGNPASIVFLSNTAAEKIAALTGIGWDNPRCDHKENQ